MKLLVPLAATIVLMLGACVAPPPPPPDQSEWNLVIDQWHDCLTKAATRLDDERSDASTVALAIVPLCADGARQIQELAGRNLNLQARMMLYRRFQDHPELDVERATTVVLQVRAQRRRLVP